MSKDKDLHASERRHAPVAAAKALESLARWAAKERGHVSVFSEAHAAMGIIVDEARRRAKRLRSAK